MMGRVIAVLLLVVSLVVMPAYGECCDEHGSAPIGEHDGDSGNSGKKDMAAHHGCHHHAGDRVAPSLVAVSRMVTVVTPSYPAAGFAPSIHPAPLLEPPLPA